MPWKCGKNAHKPLMPGCNAKSKSISFIVVFKELKVAYGSGDDGVQQSIYFLLLSVITTIAKQSCHFLMENPEFTQSEAFQTDLETKTNLKWYNTSTNWRPPGIGPHRAAAAAAAATTTTTTGCTDCGDRYNGLRERCSTQFRGQPPTEPRRSLKKTAAVAMPPAGR